VNEYQIGIAFLLLLYAGIGISMYVLVQKSGRRFIVAGKRLPLFLVGTMLFAQALDANSTLGAASNAYLFGFWTGFVYPLGLALCLLITGLFFAKKLNNMNLITLADFYYRRYSRSVEVIVAVIMCISFIILVAGNLAGTAWIVKTLFNIDYVPALFIVSFIVLAYTFSGGLFSSAATDIVQLYPAITAFVLAPLILLATYGADFFAAAIPANFVDMSGLLDVTNPDSGALINWAGILALALGDIVALDFMERVFAAKNGTVARNACFYGAGFTLVAGLGATALGLMGLALYPNIDDPRNILNEIATNNLPYLVGLFVMAGVLGAALSTANGGALAVSAVIGRNILHRNVLMPYEERKAAAAGKTLDEMNLDWHRLDNRLLNIARFMLLPVFAVSMWLAYVKPEPGIMLVLAFDVVFAGCLAPLVFGVYWKKANVWGALASVIVGSGIRLLLFMGIPAVTPGLDTLIPPLISFPLMLIVSYFTQKEDHPKWEIINYAATEEELARGTM
jgi:solute:Na+ symporter, SSS family